MKAQFTIGSSTRAAVLLTATTEEETLVLDRLREILAEQTSVPFDAALDKPKEFLDVRRVRHIAIG